VAKTPVVAAGAPLDPNNFEPRVVQADSDAATAVKLVGELQGKILSQPAQPGNPISANNLYDPSELTSTAEIIAAEISPTSVMVGGTLCIRVTVKNMSKRRLRTMGRGPGFAHELGPPPARTLQSPGMAKCTGLTASS
jgi:hypothetical protein